MVLPLLSIACSALAFCFWLLLFRDWLPKRLRKTGKYDIADEVAPDLIGLPSLLLSRGLRRIYNFIIVNFITAFIGGWHAFQMTNRRNLPDFWEGYLLTLLLFMLMLWVPAFFWVRERLRRKQSLEQESINRPDAGILP